MAIKHAFTSGKGDGSDTTLVRASNWNADHTMDALAPSGLTGATTASRYVGGTVSGAPITGTFSINDFVTAQDGKIWICTTAGSPGIWTAIGGGSDLVRTYSGAGNIYIPGLRGSPDALPASPSAADDEFEALTGWTPLGSLDTSNVTDAASNWHTSKTSPGATSLYGIYKTSPSMPFTVTAKIAAHLNGANQQGYGLFVAESSPGKLACWGPIYNSGVGINSEFIWTTWASNTSRSTYAEYYPYNYQTTVYIRMVVHASNNIDLAFSYNGYIWNKLATGYNSGLTVANVGLFVGNIGAGSPPVEAFFDWIRFT